VTSIFPLDGVGAADWFPFPSGIACAGFRSHRRKRRGETGRTQAFLPDCLGRFACESVFVAAGRIRRRARIGRIVSLDGLAPIPARSRNETRRRSYFNRWAEGRSLRI